MQPVVGVIDDVDDLFARQPDVDRVQDRPDRRHGEIELEVPMMVPGKRGDAIAGLDAQSLEHVHQPVNAAVELAVIAAMQAAVAIAADDLFVGEELGGPAQDAGDQERPVHHQSVHRFPSSSTS